MLTRPFRWSLVPALFVASSALFSAAAQAQAISTWTGGSTTNSSTNQYWTLDSAWQPTGVPTGTNVWAQLNSSTTPLMRILYSSTSLNGGVSGTSLTVGAISFLPTMVLPSGTFGVTNQSTSVRGTLKFYGIETTIDGTTRRIILDNRSPASNVTFNGPGATLQPQDFELYTSGAINVSATTQLTLNPLIRDGSGSQSITKIGDGILTFSGSSVLNTYGGGFVMSGGIVQWATSGTAGVSTPFGLGSLTLRSGTLRSTTATGKSINSNVILDGSVTLGSADAGFTGAITVNSSGGSLSTTVASNSIISIVAGGSTGWNQSTSGAGGITKAGDGVLQFTGAGGSLNHTGNTVVQSGTLIMNANLASASAVSVQSGAAMFGTGTIAGAATTVSGAFLSPGAVSGTAGLLTFGSSLGLGGQTLLELTGTARGTQYDAFNVGGALTYGGSLQLQFSGTLPEGTYNLFSGFGSQAGTFSSITALGGYSGSLSESSGVWTGTFGPQTLTFSNATGDLVIVPEPASLLAAMVVAGAVAAGRRWRGIGRRS